MKRVDQTKKVLSFYISPQDLETIDKILDEIFQDTGERTSRSCFIRLCILKEINNYTKKEQS